MCLCLCLSCLYFCVPQDASDSLQAFPTEAAAKAAAERLTRQMIEARQEKESGAIEERRRNLAAAAKLVRRLAATLRRATVCCRGAVLASRNLDLDLALPCLPQLRRHAMAWACHGWGK